MQKGFAVFIFLFACNAFGLDNNNPNFAFVEALYWQMRQGGDENWAQVITPATNPQTIDVQGAAFKWQPGFRLGLGRDLQRDSWDIALYYTRYQTKCLDSISTASGGIFSSFLGNFFVNNTNGGSITDAPHYRAAQIKWKFLFNTIDLELGRKFPIDSILTLRTFIGIKSGIINQHIFSSWNDPINVTNFTYATEHLKNDFWGVGPSFGIDSAWKIYTTNNSNFNIFANFSGALLWGHWSFSDVYQNNAPVAVTVLSKDIIGACAMGRGLIGLEWSRIFSKCKTGIRLGYEIQAWFNQVQFYSYNTGRLNEPTYLQGGILGFYFNF